MLKLFIVDRYAYEFVPLKVITFPILLFTVEYVQLYKVILFALLDKSVQAVPDPGKQFEFFTSKNKIKFVKLVTFALPLKVPTLIIVPVFGILSIPTVYWFELFAVKRPKEKVAVPPINYVLRSPNAIVPLEGITILIFSIHFYLKKMIIKYKRLYSMQKYKASTFDDYNKVMANLDKEKISKPIMTKYEFNQVISLRANQLALGSPAFVATEKTLKSNMQLRQIALQELKEGKLPYIIKRPLPNNKSEYYRIHDLDLVAVQHLMR